MPAPAFIIRIYGILIREGSVLLTREVHKGNPMLKFPGGGLEFGEGPKDCLVREFKEELGADIRVESHFYTTDFFQVSAFHPDKQVISIYYTVKLTEMSPGICSREMRENDENNWVHPEWVDLSALEITDLTFPIDRKVAEMLVNL